MARRNFKVNYIHGCHSANTTKFVSAPRGWNGENMLCPNTAIYHHFNTVNQEARDLYYWPLRWTRSQHRKYLPNHFSECVYITTQSISPTRDILWLMDCPILYHNWNLDPNWTPTGIVLSTYSLSWLNSLVQGSLGLFRVRRQNTCFGLFSRYFHQKPKSIECTSFFFFSFPCYGF